MDQQTGTICITLDQPHSAIEGALTLTPHLDEDAGVVERYHEPWRLSRGQTAALACAIGAAVINNLFLVPPVWEFTTPSLGELAALGAYSVAALVLPKMPALLGS